MSLKNLFINPKDPKLYRRWLGIFTFCILPIGCLHFLTGRIKAAIYWFTLTTLFGAIEGLYLFLPGYDSQNILRIFQVLTLVIGIVYLIDAFKKPIIRKNSLKKFLLFLLFPITTLFLALTLRHFVVEAFRISSDCMAPTLMSKDFKNNKTKEEFRLLAYKKKI